MSQRALSKGIQELRFLYCQTASNSSGLRSFVQNNFPALKTANPRLPILVRECSGATPRIVARFDLGKETTVDVSNQDENAVSQSFASLVQTK